MADMSDFFGEDFLSRLRQTAIRTQIGLILGSAQAEYFNELIKSGLTEDQAFRVMEITFGAFMKGMGAIAANALNNHKEHDDE
jgi:hypothetical protein